MDRLRSGFVGIYVIHRSNGIWMGDLTNFRPAKGVEY